MYARRGITVAATAHSIERCGSRIPRLSRWTDAQRRVWVERTVYRAIRDGRKARTCPAWCRSRRERVLELDRKKSGLIDRSQRFVWDADETAVFVVSRRGRDWLVVTVLVDEPLFP